MRGWRGLGPRPALRPATPRERRAVDSFLEGLGVRPGAAYVSLAVLVVPGARYYDVFDVPGWALGVSGEAGAFSAGFYLGYIEGDSFKPGLPLAFRLSRLCGLAIKCHRVDSFGEKVFLYGKTFFEEHVVEWGRGLSVVLGPHGEPLGWGYPVDKPKKGGRGLEPLMDLGWYLRRGG